MWLLKWLLTKHACTFQSLFDLHMHFYPKEDDAITGSNEEMDEGYHKLGKINRFYLMNNGCRTIQRSQSRLT